MDAKERERRWSGLMRAGLAGDEAAYGVLLREAAAHLRSVALRLCAAHGAAAGDAEDIVQETLLAVHLKRGSWDPDRPIGPWLGAILRNKLIDALRRRGRRVIAPIEDVMDTLAAPQDEARDDLADADRLIGRLKEPQRDIVRSISLDGASVRDTARRLKMTENAVRVALHRALKTLADLYRRQDSED